LYDLGRRILVQNGSRWKACIETELMADQLNEKRIQILLPHRVVPSRPRRACGHLRICPGRQFVPERSDDRVLTVVRATTENLIGVIHSHNQRHDLSTSIATLPIMTLRSASSEKSNIPSPPWRGSRMTALLQSTPPRARNRLGLARLTEAGSANYAIAGFWLGYGLAATHEHRLPRPVKQAEAPCPAEV
jgi:hypothetical protein